jgi:hypothetical protein
LNNGFVKDFRVDEATIDYGFLSLMPTPGEGF